MKLPNQIPVETTKLSAESDDWKERALVLRGQRQSMLAGNIANVDTPGYVAKDISFSAAMQAASERMTTALSTSSVNHFQVGTVPAMSTMDFIRYATPAQSNLDGNSVDMDRERSSFAQNSIMYQFAVNVLNDDYEEFRMASSDPRKG